MNLEFFRFMISSIVNESDVKFKLNLSIKNNFQDGGLFASVCWHVRYSHKSKAELSEYTKVVISAPVCAMISLASQ